MEYEHFSDGKRLTDLRADWHHPTRIRFGAGRASELPDVCNRLGIGRPLLVTDPGLAGRAFFQWLSAALRAQEIEPAVFSAVTADPEKGCIAEGARRFGQAGCDGIVAVGGGSALDAGKAIALAVAAGPEDIWTFVLRKGRRPPQLERRRVPPVVTVPTTAGTGSEVNAYAVVTDAEDRVKRSLFHPAVMPGIVIADPALTSSLPPALTAATGMDALSHNLEALCAPPFSPISDAAALQGLRYANEWLLPAFRSRRNIKARCYTMAASILGAVSFEKGLGAAHAMAHAVGAVCKTHHGTTVGAVLPHVLRFNQRRIEKKMAAAARFLGLPRQGGQAMIDWLESLRSSLDMPASLSALGVQEEQIPELTDRALKDANAPANPVPLDRRALERLFYRALSGRR